MSSWTIRRHPDVVGYLVPGDPQIRDERRELRRAIESLKSGIPADAHFVENDPATKLPTQRWIEARHWIYFIVNEGERWINVTKLESTTIE